jgi:hypothetical protein
VTIARLIRSSTSRRCKTEPPRVGGERIDLDGLRRLIVRRGPGLPNFCRLLVGRHVLQRVPFTSRSAKTPPLSRHPRRHEISSWISSQAARGQAPQCRIARPDPISVSPRNSTRSPEEGCSVSVQNHRVRATFIVMPHRFAIPYLQWNTPSPAPLVGKKFRWS